jgi:TatA/E family protein of Tat protein translocase
MPFVGTGHLWLIGIILVIVLIIWGPGKLPDVGSGLGRAIREFRKASADTKAEFHKATAPEATVAPVADAPVAPVATAPVTPVAQPATVGGGPTAVPTEHVATEGDHTAAS